MEHPNFEDFPLLKDAEFVECILQAGELLYIPVSYQIITKKNQDKDDITQYLLSLLVLTVLTNKKI